MWWEEGKCALGQSVVKLAAQLLALMDKTACFQLVLGETFQPVFYGIVCQALELFWTGLNFSACITRSSRTSGYSVMRLRDRVSAGTSWPGNSLMQMDGIAKFGCDWQHVYLSKRISS